MPAWQELQLQQLWDVKAVAQVTPREAGAKQPGLIRQNAHKEQGNVGRWGVDCHFLWFVDVLIVFESCFLVAMFRVGHEFLQLGWMKPGLKLNFVHPPWQSSHCAC